jgi:hypothetical protein
MPANVAKRHGARVIMGYLSNDASKNLSSAEIKAHHGQGVGVVLGWESMTGRALGGAATGTADAQVALAQMKQHAANLGYGPKVPVAVPFAVDQDVNAGQFPQILAYLNAAQKVFDADKSIRLVASAYGEFDLIEYLAGHGISRGLFQTYAWSGGKISTHTDLYQFNNGQTVEGYSVDFDKVLNVHALGAWWPPNHPLNQPPKPAPKPTPATPSSAGHKPLSRGRLLHVVKPRETLSGIAAQNHISLRRLFWLNRFRHPFLRRNARKIQVNWKIRVR